MTHPLVAAPFPAGRVSLLLLCHPELGVGAILPLRHGERVDVDMVWARLYARLASEALERGVPHDDVDAAIGGAYQAWHSSDATIVGLSVYDEATGLLGLMMMSELEAVHALMFWRRFVSFDRSSPDPMRELTRRGHLP